MINALFQSFGTQFICVGTNYGSVRLLDHQGNQITPFADGRVPAAPRVTFPPHLLSVSQISVDSKGEYVATCSSDGTVGTHECMLITSRTLTTLHCSSQTDQRVRPVHQ